MVSTVQPLLHIYFSHFLEQLLAQPPVPLVLHLFQQVQAMQLKLQSHSAMMPVLHYGSAAQPDASLPPIFPIVAIESLVAAICLSSISYNITRLAVVEQTTWWSEGEKLLTTLVLCCFLSLSCHTFKLFPFSLVFNSNLKNIWPRPCSSTLKY
jgi:hypothetical protein